MAKLYHENMAVQIKALLVVTIRNAILGSVFFVRDNGIGIEPQYHERIFGLFNRLDPNVDGTGIGLSLVKRIIEVHEGKIWVESQPGEGTTFLFTLPLVESPNKSTR